MWTVFTVAALLLAVGTQRSFVDTAPSPPPQQGSPEIVPETLDANVRELESLKQTIGKTLEMMKTQSRVYADVNGHKESHSDSRSEVKEDGNLVARIGQHVDRHSLGAEGQSTGKVRTDMDIPSKGIHKSFVEQLAPEYTQYTENGNRRSGGYDNIQDANTLDLGKYGAYAGTQYSPLDMAEYVFWTGDEKGVTLAIEEFLQEGLMSREEAISFLQEIKYNLDYLQSHYTQLGLNARDRSKQFTYIQFAHILVWIMYICLCCLMGERLYGCSLDLADVVYDSIIWDGDLETQKAMLLIMIRAQRPIRLSGGLEKYASHTLLVNIMKASYSIIALFLE